MMGHRVRWVVGRRGVCSAKEKREYRQPTELPVKDPSYFWVEPSGCKELKTWRDIEEEYACALMIRFSQKIAPERRMFNMESGDLYICRRGCLQHCIAPPCYDPEYPSALEKALYRLTRLTALAIFLGLVYGSYRLHIWEPTSSTLDSVLEDPDNTVDQISTVGTIVAKWWNNGVAMMFSGIRWVFPPGEREAEFDQRDFILTVQEDLHERKEQEAAGIVKEDENVFEDWELVYNYVPEPPKLAVELGDDSDWSWAGHRDPDYVIASKSPMPYEKGARMLKRLRDQDGVTLAAIYSDLCAEWAVTKGAVEMVEIECFEDSPEGQVCKRKLERRKNVRINPADCNTCPYRQDEEKKE